MENEGVSHQLTLRALILEVVNDIIRLEGGAVPVREIRIVPGSSFFGLSHGTAILLENGGVALRVAVGRPTDEVVDTILHEIAHILLGREHIDVPDHGPHFQKIYAHLKRKYSPLVTDRLGLR